MTGAATCCARRWSGARATCSPSPDTSAAPPSPRTGSSTSPALGTSRWARRGSSSDNLVSSHLVTCVSSSEHHNADILSGNSICWSDATAKKSPEDWTLDCCPARWPHGPTSGVLQDDLNSSKYSNKQTMVIFKAIYYMIIFLQKTIL